MSGSLAGPGVTPPVPTKSTETARASLAAWTTRESSEWSAEVGLTRPSLKWVGASMPQGMIFALKRDVVNDQDPKNSVPAASRYGPANGRGQSSWVQRGRLAQDLLDEPALALTRRKFVAPLEQPAKPRCPRSRRRHGTRRIDQFRRLLYGLNLDSLTPKAATPCGPGESKYLSLLCPRRGDLAALEHHR